MNFCRKMDVIERIKLYQIIKAKTCSMNELIFIVIIEFYTNRCFNKNLLYRENLIFMIHRTLDTRLRDFLLQQMAFYPFIL